MDAIHEDGAWEAAQSAASDKGEGRAAGGDPAPQAGCPLTGPQPGDDPALERRSNTPGLSSQSIESVNLPDGVSAVAAIDNWISAGRIAWDGAHHPAMTRLEEVYRLARDTKQQQPFALAGKPLFVFENGMGAGRQSRLTYRLEWGGVTIGIADRPADKRNVYNFQLQVSGTACLLWGLESVREIAFAMVEELGGTLRDEWTRRIDICLDLPGLDLRSELLPAFMEERFITSALNWNPWSGKGGTTGFSVGRGGSVTLNVYDKLVESATRKSPDYYRAMIDRRWGGIIPSAATRLEYQARKPWLDAHGFTTADAVLKGLPNIVHLLTAESRPLFRMTADRVDRENKHQSRASTLPLWAVLLEVLQRWTGEPGEPPPRIERGLISLKRVYTTVRSMLAKAAAMRGEVCENIEDGIEVFRKLEALCDGTADAWERLWSDHARKLGTLDSVTSFPPPEVGF